MNVYIVKYEYLEVFSTARKAIEHVKSEFDGAYVDGGYTDDYTPLEDTPISELKTEKMIAELGKVGRLEYSLGGHDVVTIDKERVR